MRSATLLSVLGLLACGTPRDPSSASGDTLASRAATDADASDGGGSVASTDADPRDRTDGQAPPGGPADVSTVDGRRDGATPPASTDHAPPGGSLYQLDIPLIGPDGQPRGWDAVRGAPTLIAMVYTTCPAACPLIIQQVQGILGATGRDDARVLLVSFDPERDTPAALQALVERFTLDGRWTVTVSTEEGARQLAAALAVRYRKLPDGEFTHSQVVVLLDAQGVPVARGEGGDSEPIIAALAR